MASRGDDLNTRITATDDASAVVDKVADKVGDLEDHPHDVDLGVNTSDAEREISSLDRRLAGLTNEEKRVVLDVMARDAQRDLDRINRDLARADRYDDTEIEIRVNAKGNAENKLKAIQSEIGEIEQQGKGLSDKFGDVGSDMASNLLAGFGAAGVGAALVQGIQLSWDKAAGIRQITNEFRLTADEADRYGKIAGDLYANNWGEALGEVQQGVALTARRLRIDTDAELARIAEGAFAISSTWNQEFGAVVRSVSQLLDNGLVPSAQRGLDLIVRAFQAGGDEADDLLDTIDEYSQHWSAMGLSGEEALNQIVAGLQDGQRDADKLADAVKEMRIRAVEDTDTISAAYSSLGLDADDMRAKFLAGGDSAKQAFLTVIEALRSVDDPIEQNRLAIELIGTQFEDLGPRALDALVSIEGKLGDVAGAVKEVGDNIEATPWDQLQRDVEGWLGRLGDGLGRVAGWNPGGDFGQGFPQARDDIDDTAIAADDLATGLENVVYQSGRLSRGFGQREMDEVIHKLGLTRSELDALYAAAAPPWERLRSELNETAGILEGAPGWFEDMETAAANAAAGAVSSIEGIGAALDGVLGRLSEEGAVNDIADQWDRIIEAQAEYMTAEKNGSSEATKARRDYRDELLRLASDVAGFARQVGDIPEERLVRLAASIEAGSLTEIEAALDAIFTDRQIRLDVTGASVPTRFRRTDDGGWEMVDRGSSAAVTTQAPNVTNNYNYTIAPSPVQTYDSLRDFTFANGQVAR